MMCIIHKYVRGGVGGGKARRVPKTGDGGSDGHGVAAKGFGDSWKGGGGSFFFPLSIEGSLTADDFAIYFDCSGIAPQNWGLAPPPIHYYKR